MGLEVPYSSTYNYIKTVEKENNISLTDKQKRALLDYMMENIYKSPIADEDAIEMIRNMPMENAKPLKIYLPEERQVRREKAEMLREKMIHDTIAYEDMFKKQTAKGRTFKRYVKAFFKQIPQNATAQELEAINEYNEKIGALFNDDRATMNAYIEEKSKAENKSQDEIRQEMQQERANIVREKLKEVNETFENLEELCDDRLPGKKLVENYWSVNNAMIITMEAENFKKDFTDDLSEEEKSLCTKFKAQCDYTSYWANRIYLAENWMYEYVNSDDLSDYKIDDFATAAVNASAKIDKKSLMENPKDDFLKNTVLYNTDGTESTMSMPEFMSKIVLANDNNLQKIYVNDVRNNINFKKQFKYEAYFSDLRKYGFEKDEYPVSDKERMKQPDEPIAHEKNGRVMIFAKVDGGTVHDQPELLFNNKLAERNNELSEKLKAADSVRLRLFTRSPYNNMRTAMENIAKLPPMNANSNLEYYKEQYQDLLKSAYAYTGYKETNKQTDRNLREEERYAIGQDVVKYAREKLKQIRQISDARYTLDRYDGLTRAALREQFEREDGMVGGLGTMRSREKARRQNSVEWIKYNLLNYPNVPRAVKEINEHSEELLSFLNDKKSGPKDVNRDNVMATANVVGAALATNLVTFDYSGKMRRFFSGKDAGNAMQMLGEEALKTYYGENIDILNNKNLNNFLETFDVYKLSDKLRDKLSVFESSISMSDVLKKKYIDMPQRKAQKNPEFEQALGDFAKTNIIKPLEYLDTKQDSFKFTEATGKKVLSSCTLYSLLQTQYMSGAKDLTSLINEPKKLEAGLKQIQNKDEFKELFNQYANAHGEITVAQMKKLVGGNKNKLQELGEKMWNKQVKDVKAKEPINKSKTVTTQKNKQNVM